MDMDNVSVFDQSVEAYEMWFEEHKLIFESELAAIKQLLPLTGSGIEIGAGTGLFSAHLGIKHGVEPSEKMRRKAIERGLTISDGFAESLPVPDGTYHFALMITVDCFLQDVLQAFKEARRILSEEGFFLVAFIDRETTLGKLYDDKKNTSVYYKHARFHTASEIRKYLTLAGFIVVEERQTIFNMENRMHEVKNGTGEGVFGVIKAKKIAVI